MIPSQFALLGALIAALGGFYYLYETIVGKSKPNRVTWLLWFIFPMLAFFAQISQGVGLIAWVSFVSGFTPLLIFIASFFNKKAYWKTTRIDYVCFFASIVGISLWAITKNANLAIIFSIIADLFAALPTLIKCYKQPETESWLAYGLSTIGFGFTILTIQNFSFQAAAFVIYLTSINGVMAILASRKPSRDILQFEPV